MLPAMTDSRIERSAPAVPVVSPGELAPYAIFGAVLCLLLVYFVGVEQGALSVFSGMGVHEFVHDARHLLGFPCH
jgi:Probable cobalt transporter subunit (CbtB)